jgi:hypothetical protein
LQTLSGILLSSGLTVTGLPEPAAVFLTASNIAVVLKLQKKRSI